MRSDEIWIKLSRPKSKMNFVHSGQRERHERRESGWMPDLFRTQ